MIAKLYQPVYAQTPDSPEGIWKTLPVPLVLERGTFLAGDEWLFRIARVTYLPEIGEIRYDSEDYIELGEADEWVKMGGWKWEDA